MLAITLHIKTSQMKNQAILNEAGITFAAVPQTKFFAVRNGCIFQICKDNNGGRTWNFIANGAYWKFGSRFEKIEDLISAIIERKVGGAIRIFSGNTCYGKIVNGVFIANEKPIKQLI